MEFKNVKNISIPEGNVISVSIGKKIVWSIKNGITVTYKRPTAVLYDDGSLVFYAANIPVTTNKTIVETYENWHRITYN